MHYGSWDRLQPPVTLIKISGGEWMDGHNLESVIFALKTENTRNCYNYYSFSQVNEKMLT